MAKSIHMLSPLRAGGSRQAQVVLQALQPPSLGALTPDDVQRIVGGFIQG